LKLFSSGTKDVLLQSFFRGPLENRTEALQHFGEAGPHRLTDTPRERQLYVMKKPDENTGIARTLAE